MSRKIANTMMGTMVQSMRFLANLFAAAGFASRAACKSLFAKYSAFGLGLSAKSAAMVVFVRGETLGLPKKSG